MQKTNDELAEMDAAYLRLREAASSLVDFMDAAGLWGLIQSEADERIAKAVRYRLEHLLRVFKEPRLYQQREIANRRHSNAPK